MITFIQWLMKVTKRDCRFITGCDAHNGGRDSIWLTRYFLIKTERFGNLYLHVIHRSDADRVCHDHPWPFVALLLWCGYIEHTPTRSRRYYPGAVLFRRADWAHRLELPGEKPAVSLVWVGKKVRIWGFLTADGWKDFVTFGREKGCEE